MKKYDLLPHQVRCVEYGLKNPYFICAVSPGLGKSLISLDLADRLKAKMLVVCPSYLILNWKREIQKFFGDTKQVSVVKNAKDVYPLWDTDICLASYEFANSYDLLFEWADLVVFEEGHYLKNIKAKRTEACHRLLYQYSNKRMIILTGTPIKNRVQEFYSLIALCNYNPRIKDPPFLKEFPEEISFAERYSFKSESRISIFSAKAKRMIEVPLIKFTGIQNIEELKGWLKGIYIRVRDTEFMKTDGFRYKDFICGKDGDEELYKSFLEFMEENQGIAPKLKVKSAMEKVPYTIKYVKDLLEEVNQVVIYSDHVEPCQKIAEAFGVVGITGSMSVDQRMKIADQFFRKEIRVIVATIGSFSTGINNLVVANNMVFNDPSWVVGDMEQAIKRIDRIGQTKKCIIHRVMGTVQDEKIYEALEEKRKVIGRII